MLPSKILEDAQVAAVSCDVMLVVGTSGLVNPAASLPLLAKSKGATVIEVNPNDTPITVYADHKLSGRSGDMLPQVIDALG